MNITIFSWFYWLSKIVWRLDSSWRKIEHLARYCTESQSSYSGSSGHHWHLSCQGAFWGSLVSTSPLLVLGLGEDSPWSWQRKNPKERILTKLPSIEHSCMLLIWYLLIPLQRNSTKNVQRMAWHCSHYRNMYFLHHVFAKIHTQYRASLKK